MKYSLPKVTLALSGFLLLLSPSLFAASPAPKGVELYLISPQEGAQLKSPVRVRFGLKGMGVAPAGVRKKNTGHHHLLVDVQGLPALNQAIAKDARHLHFGGGQTEVSLKLKPGQHSLRLILGDHAHIPHNPPVISQEVNFTVR